MGCIKGISFCENCGKEFEWMKHDSQAAARFCSRKCTNKDFGVIGNKDRTFWPNATEAEKKERIKNHYTKKVIKKRGCWGWRGSLDKNGYPQIGAGSKKLKGHRISYEIHKGEIPKGRQVCHTCDNPTCTNPDHLWLGSIKENNEDRIIKGRCSKGEERPNAKLKDCDIREIRKMLKIGVSKAALARKYKISYTTVYLIEKKKTWRHVI